jgi:hypothetical protein
MVSTIAEKQAELHSILMKLKPAKNSSCYSIPNQCWQEVHSAPAFSDYATSVGKFLLNNDVIDIASSESARHFLETSQAILRNQSSPQENKIPSDPEGYFKYVQTALPDVATSCAGSTIKADCYVKFGGHCKSINMIKNRALKRRNPPMSVRDLSRNLSEENAVHAAANPIDNPDFKRFNDVICLQQHSNTNGEKLNFFEFQTKHCQTNPLSECSDRKKLLERFLSEYGNGENPEETNTIAGFREILKDATYLKVSEIQIAVANNVTESPSELRERFGGDRKSVV